MKVCMFFILGVFVGGLTMTIIMCCLEINRLNRGEDEN